MKSEDTTLSVHIHKTGYLSRNLKWCVRLFRGELRHVRLNRGPQKRGAAPTGQRQQRDIFWPVRGSLWQCCDI